MPGLMRRRWQPLAAASPADLLGTGHLAMTIDQGAHMQRYQGLVPLDGQGLEEAAHQYFLRSEQIPTRVRLAVAEEIVAEHGESRRRWRAGGLFVQFLPQSLDRQRQAEFDPGDAPEGTQAPDFSRMTPGSRRARWSKRSRITN
jgi:molecular chaperone Hsp33